MVKSKKNQESQSWNEFLNWLKTLTLTNQSNKINYFTVTKMLTRETKHSAFLAWLFDPNECHYLGREVLKSFLEKVFDFKYPLTPFPQNLKSNQSIISKSRQDFLDLLNDVTGVEVGTEIITKYNPEGKDQKRIDVLIHIPVSHTVIVIENKMFTQTHDNQLINYETHIDGEFNTFNDANGNEKEYNKFFIYLTPGGKTDKEYLPLNSEDDTYNNRWCIITYNEIKYIVENVILKIKRKDILVKQPTVLTTILTHYNELIENEVIKMGNSTLWNIINKLDKESIEKVEKIYEAISNKKDNISYIKKELKARLESVFGALPHFYADNDFSCNFATPNMSQKYIKNGQYDSSSYQWICGSQNDLRVMLLTPKNKTGNRTIVKYVTLLTYAEWLSPLQSIQKKLDDNLNKAVDLVKKVDNNLP